MSRLRHFAMFNDVPYYACKYGFSDIEGFMQCETCHRRDFCDLVQDYTAILPGDNFQLSPVEMRDRILDCVNGHAMSPTFFKCAECPCTANCKIFNSGDFYDQQEVYYQNLRNESLENRATYYRTDYGMWRNSDFDDVFRNFKSVEKDKYAPDILLYNSCMAGDATHPKFWRCEKCRLKETCKLGAVRLRKVEEKKLRDVETVRNFFKSAKKFFEKVADVFDNFFRRR